MLKALLYPLSGEYWQRRTETNIERYYEGLTRESMTSALRHDLLLDYSQGHSTEFIPVFWKRSTLRGTFDEFAVNSSTTGSSVWTQREFADFISSRLGNAHPESTAPLARILWRSFYYNAVYPFADPYADPRDQTVDVDGWIQAMKLLSTDAARNVGRNRASLVLYGYSRTLESRRQCDWHRFASMATPSDGKATATKTVTDDECDDWDQPDMLDEIARVAACQLPLNMCIMGPLLAEIRPRVEKLVGKSRDEDPSTKELVIPYEEILALLVTIMQLTEGDLIEGSADEERRPVISPGGDSVAHVMAAKAILIGGGIHEGTAVSFAEYFSFSGKYNSPGTFFPWSFDQEIGNLWRALLSTQNGSAPTPPSPQQCPPTVVLHMLQFLSPLDQEYSGTGRIRRRSTLNFSTDSESGLSRDEVLKALSWPYSPKLALVSGTTTVGASSSHVSSRLRSKTQDANDGQAAMFAIVTSSPLWCEYKTGAISDFFIGDSHLLLELAPRPRALWWSAKKTKYVDLVDVSESGKISFGRAAADTNGTVRSSGLTVDFQAGTATLSSSSHRDSRSAHGYKEIAVGPCNEPGVTPVEVLDNTQAWETTIRLQKVEVYSLPDGVVTGLSVTRKTARR